MEPNRETCFEILNYNANLFLTLPLWVRDDKEMVLAALMGEHVLQYTSERMRNDEEVVMAFGSMFGWNLEHASERLRDNMEIVLAAINQYEFSLRYASERLRNDENVVFTAVSTCGETIIYASDRLRDNKNIQNAAAHGAG